MDKFLDKTGLTYLWSKIKIYVQETFVPNTRTINGNTLSSNIMLTASDVGALSEGVDVVLLGESLGTATFNEGGNN